MVIFQVIQILPLELLELFGFNLMRNFAFPYFSRDIAEFWRRWHISLSTWFRDYLYIPLGGSRGGTWIKVRNTFIIFIVSGFWHGANWTFIVWGAFNAIYFLPLLLRNKNRVHLGAITTNYYFPSLNDGINIIITFLLTVLAWVFFRAENISHALNYFSELFSLSLFTIPEILPLEIMILIALFLIIEWFGRDGLYALDGLNKFKSPFIKIGVSFLLIICTILYMSNSEQEFIYFQF